MTVAARRGLFSFVDPPADFPGATPEEFVQVLVDAFDQIDYPWHRLLPGLRARGISTITVEWVTPNPGGALAVWHDSGRIVMGYDYGLSGHPFSFAHEVGHAVDALTFSWATQQRLMALWHGLRCKYHWPEIVDANDPSRPHAWAHENEHSEMWVSRNDYLFRHNESFADAFVAAFAPTIWAPRGPYGRFVHWPSDYSGYDPSAPTNPTPVPHYDEVRAITLEEPIMAFTDVPDTHPHAEGIHWAAGLGLVAGYGDGTFKPDIKVRDGSGAIRSDVKIEGALSRGAFCTVLMRYHDQFGGT